MTPSDDAQGAGNRVLAKRSSEARELYRSCQARARTRYLVVYPLLVLVVVLIAVAGYWVEKGIPDRAAAAPSEVAAPPSGLETAAPPDRAGAAPLEAATEALRPDLRDLEFCDGSGIVVGDNGAVLLSRAEGGWKEVASGTRRGLESVAYSGDCATVMAAGDDGVILRSHDGGATWSAMESNTRTSFNDIALVADGSVAAAVGGDGVVRVSFDSGATWRNAGNLTAASLNGIAAGAAGRMIAVGDDNTVLSFDGNGWTVQEVFRPDGEEDNYDLEAVAFGGNTFVAIGDEGLIVVRNRNWRVAGVSGDHGRRRAPPDLRAIAVSADGRAAVAVGDRGSIANSVDGGSNWTWRKSVTGLDLDAAALNGDGRIAAAVGEDGLILVSSNRGVNWCGRDSQTANEMNDVAFGRADGAPVAIGEGGAILRIEIRPGSCEGEVYRETVNWLSGETPLAIREIEVREREIEAEREATAAKREATAAEREEIAAEREEIALREFIAVTLYRFAVGLLIVFLIQHVISLARYNLRLAAVYHALADTVLLTEDKPLPHPKSVEELEQAIRALTPDTDFGRQPKTVIDQAMRMARAIMRGRGGGSSGGGSPGGDSSR